MSGMTRRRKLTSGLATVALCGTLAIGMTSEAPLILYPITPSLRPGLYVRTFVPPKVGTIAAFRVPEAAKRYKASIGEEVSDDFLFMKPIVAGPSDHVCVRMGDGVYINGIRIAPETGHGAADRHIPIWRNCRRLDDDEFFTLSTHTSASFDSRHYGPIRMPFFLGSYRFVIAHHG